MTRLDCHIAPLTTGIPCGVSNDSSPSLRTHSDAIPFCPVPPINERENERGEFELH